VEGYGVLLGLPRQFNEVWWGRVRDGSSERTSGGVFRKELLDGGLKGLSEGGSGRGFFRGKMRGRGGLHAWMLFGALLIATVVNSRHTGGFPAGDSSYCLP
jgi:hypothetical protein